MLLINNQKFGHEYFGNNEAIYKDVSLNDDSNTIQLNFEDNRDIANLIFAVQYIRDEKPNATKLYLNMPYLP